MANRLKPILSLIGFIVLFLLVAPYLLQAVFSIIKKPHTLIDYPDAVQGRITSVEIERRYHMYYLDNNTKRWYSFNAFLPSLTPAQQAHLGQKQEFNLSLGQKLKVGDYVSKQANSTLITVQRGDIILQYFCATPEEMEQARK